MEKWELAQVDREQHGMKYQEIADKYGVSVNTVKSWASRYWKKGRAAAAPAEGLQPSEKLQPEKLQPAPPPPQSRGGAPPGNQNAKGNRGNREAKGGPPGNTNSMTHGAYSRKYADLVDEDVIREILTDCPDDPLRMMDERIRDLKIQEAYYIGRIRKISRRYPAGMGVHDATKRTSYLRTGIKDEETVQTRTLAVDDLLRPLYVELNKVQRLLLSAIRDREAIDINRRRQELAELRVTRPAEETPEDVAMKELTIEELRALVQMGGVDGAGKV